MLLSSLSSQRWGGLLIGAALFGLNRMSYSTAPVKFESIESKTTENHPGEALAPEKWEALMIKVDKTQRPYRVTYHQLLDGKETEFRVSCYLCHSNGPRAVRAHSESEGAPLTTGNKLLVNYMNLVIKSYGKMKTLEDSLKRRNPLMFKGRNDLKTLEVASCTMCHHDHWWGRGILTRQQAMPITHLIAKNQMPPWPFTLSAEEKTQIKEFIQGF